MKPKSIRAAIQMMLPEVEEMLSIGFSREDVFNTISVRYELKNVNVRSFDTALYRARKKRLKNNNPINLYNETEKISNHEHGKKNSLANTEMKNKQSAGILSKEFFDEAKTDFDPNEFMKKY